MNPRMMPKPDQGRSKGPSPAELLAKMPRRPMSPEQQTAALQMVQQQATDRVKLGQQLFDAADAKLKEHQQVLEEINQQQQILREQVQEDVAKSLLAYDQWMGKIDESFTSAIDKLNRRIDSMELRVDASRGEMESMIEKAAALLNQTQGLLAEVFEEDDEFIDAVTEAVVDEVVDGVTEEVAAEMQSSVPEDPHCDIDRYPSPPIDKNSEGYGDAMDLFDVEIADAERDPLENGDASATDLPADETDDVFGDVLRRLRSQVDDDGGGDDHAAA